MAGATEVTVALDTSAIMAVYQAETGAERVIAALEDAVVSSVNMAEFATKLSDRGLTPEQATETIDALSLTVVSFDAEQAMATGHLRAATRKAGLSLGDRACLALALSRGVPAMTADRAWGQVDLGVEIEVIR